MPRGTPSRAHFPMHGSGSPLNFYQASQNCGCKEVRKMMLASPLKLTLGSSSTRISFATALLDDALVQATPVRPVRGSRLQRFWAIDDEVPQACHVSACLLHHSQPPQRKLWISQFSSSLLAFFDGLLGVGNRSLSMSLSQARLHPRNSFIVLLSTEACQ